jgi:hypothetical protein
MTPLVLLPHGASFLFFSSLDGSRNLKSVIRLLVHVRYMLVLLYIDGYLVHIRSPTQDILPMIRECENASGLCCLAKILLLRYFSSFTNVKSLGNS